MKKVLTVLMVMLLCAGLLFALYICFKPIKVNVGVINRVKLLSNWPKYRDLMSEYQVERDLLVSALPKDPANMIQSQKENIEKMNKKWSEKGKELDAEFTKIVENVAKNKKINMVISDYTVEFGGMDITNEVKSKLQ